jgi:hypothetical protein
MITKMGLVVLCSSSVAILALSSWICLRLLKKAKDPDRVVAGIWVPAQILIFGIVIILMNAKQVHGLFGAFVPALILVYEVSSLYIIYQKYNQHIEVSGELMVAAWMTMWSIFKFCRSSYDAATFGMVMTGVLIAISFLSLVIHAILSIIPQKKKTDA